jgi:hypothetical protein
MQKKKLLSTFNSDIMIFMLLSMCFFFFFFFFFFFWFSGLKDPYLLAGLGNFESVYNNPIEEMHLVSRSMAIMVWKNLL